MSGIVSTKRFGDVEVSLVDAATLLWTPVFDIDRFLDGNRIERDAAGRVVLGHNFMCVRTPADVVLVDPSNWVEGEDYGELEITDPHPLAAVLAEISIAADDVSHVVISHAHFDHVTGLVEELDGRERVRFPNATVHLSRLDWDALIVRNEAGGRDRLLRSLGPVERAGRLHLVDGDAAICPGVDVVHTAGESPGHQAIRVTGGGQTVYYLGDQFHFAFEFPRPDWTPMQGKILEELARGRRRILDEAAERRATLVFTHAPFPAWGSVDPETWTWRFEADAVAAPVA